MSKSITFPRHPNVVYVADKRIKECGSRGLGEDVRCVCTSVQYKCTVYSVQCTVQGLGEDVRYVSEE